MEHLGGDDHEAVGKVSMKFKKGSSWEIIDFRVINV